MTAIQRFAIHGTIMNPHSSGPYVRHEDHLAAMQGRCLAQIEEPAGAAPAAVAGPAGSELDWDVLPENPGERARFDRQLSQLYGGDPRVFIATSLRLWAETRGSGFFGAQCAVFANEVAKMHIAAPALEAPAASAVPPGFALVPLRLTRAMEDAISEEDWQWADLLAAAQAVTEEQYALAAAPQAPAAPVVDASEPVLGEWPRVSGVGRDAESPRTLLLYLQTEASNDELRAIHDALLDGGALATHALSELMHIGYRVEGGKLVPPEKLSIRASEFFGVTAVAAKATAAHSDDLAVDRFATEMKSKLAAARAKGRGGWETCPPQVLSRVLREHTDKGDPRDVANFCMFLWCLGYPIGAAPAAPAVDAETVKKAARYDWLRDFHNGPDGVQANLPHIAAGSDNDLVWALIGEDADAGIDAAIAAQAAAKGTA